ncbi:MAG: fatty acyl-AMP ligase [Geminicoccaceae bacterium]|nr:fatty acyl-AMP ligase [Geminicoccaceae bacterium]
MVKPTTTSNARLAFRSEGFATLAEGLDYAAGGETGVNFFGPRGDLLRALSYAELRGLALDFAARLAATRLKRGDRVGIVAETGPDFLVAFFGCQYAGFVPVPLPLSINFGGREAYVERLRGMLLAAGARAAIASADLLGTLQEAARPTATAFVATVRDLMDGPCVGGGLAPLGAGDPCYIQYSSGSTSFPRGVLVTQSAIAANARAIAVDGIALRQGDRCTSWLPLYHDMGLVGCCLTPILNQISVDYLATTSFARRPFVWLKLLSDMGGTISFSPTFGYELCARRAENGQVPALDLGRWRVAGIGGEMIRANALQRFAETFAPLGFDPRAFLPSYGMAEATLAVTFAKRGRGVTIDRVARGEALERRKVAEPARTASAPIRDFVVCGRPMPGYAVEVRDAHDNPLPERHVGRVCIQGPSLMDGYFRNADATRAAITPDGWLDSGDLGYMMHGELVVTGRSKDLIILGGRNIWPQDLEWAVERLDRVRAGDVAAFAVTGEEDEERLVVLVECRTRDPLEQVTLRRAVQATVQRVAGAEATVVLVPVRSLTFTTSGKLSRATAKGHYESGLLRDVAEAYEAGTAVPVEAFAATA